MMSPYLQRFVRHIDEMGSRWGLNRTLGQMIQKLLEPRRNKQVLEEATRT